MWGREVTRLLLIGVLASACDCSKADDASSSARTTKATPSAAASTPTTQPSPRTVQPDGTTALDDDVADLMDDGDDDDGDAGATQIAHYTSGSVAMIPDACEPTMHTELERLFDCPGWSIRISWIATKTRPPDLARAATAALPQAKRRIISTKPRAGGVVLLTDQSDGSRGFEGWFHHTEKLVYLQTRAPRAQFASLSERLETVAEDFVDRNTTRKKR